MFEGLEDEDFSFGNETFMPKKSIKKLVLKNRGSMSDSPSRASSVIDEINDTSVIEPDSTQNDSQPM